MYKTVQNCQHCGANLTIDDMRQANCPYCGTVYPHHSMAAQHAQVAGQMMNQLVQQQAQIQNQWRGAYGAPPLGQPSGQPPMMGLPGQPGSPYGDPAQFAQAQMAHVQKTARRITLIVSLAVAGILLIAGLVLALSLAR